MPPDESTVLVALRTCLRSVQHGSQSKHRCHALASYGQPDPSIHHLRSLDHYRALQRSFLLCVHLPMPAFGILLDAIYGRCRTVHQPEHHCQHDVRLFCYHLRWRLDFRYPTVGIGLGLANAESTEDCGWCCVDNGRNVRNKLLGETKYR